MNVLVSDDAERDIVDGIAFYGASGPDVGSYFYLSILADLQALSVFGGIHSKRFGYHCMPAKRLPFAIYYTVSDSTVYETRIGSPGDWNADNKGIDLRHLSDRVKGSDEFSNLLLDTF